jgi:hypothetical protein
MLDMVAALTGVPLALLGVLDLILSKADARLGVLTLPPITSWAVGVVVLK